MTELEELYRIGAREALITNKPLRKMLVKYIPDDKTLQEVRDELAKVIRMVAPERRAVLREALRVRRQHPEWDLGEDPEGHKAWQERYHNGAR